MKETMYKFLRGYGIVIPYVFTAILYHMFFTAYFSPYKALIIKINVYGEALPEAILLIALAPLMIYHGWKRGLTWHDTG